MFKKTTEQHPEVSIPQLSFDMSTTPTYEFERLFTMPSTPTNESTRVDSPINERPTIMGIPVLEYPIRVSTPVLRRTVLDAAEEQAMEAAERIITLAEEHGVAVARQQERAQQAAVHAAMIVQSRLVFEIPQGQALHMFGNRSPPATITRLPPAGTTTPSPEPLPIPPRRVDTPFPQDLPHTNDPAVPPVYSPQYAPPDYAPRSPTPEPQEEGELTPEPTTAEAPGEYPGPGWIPNIDEEGVVHEYTVPVGEEDLEIAPFFQYDLEVEPPEIRLTQGRNCRVHSRLLRARARPYPCPILTSQQRLLFRERERHTRFVDQALDLERDVSLRAEVQHFRNSIDKSARIAAFIADAKEAFFQARWDEQRSADRLGAADAYTRLRTRVLTEVIPSSRLPSSHH
jgi:hypothetical protein